MAEKSDGVLVANGCREETEMSYDSRPKSTRRVSGRRKQDGNDDAAERRASRGRHPADTLSKAAATAWSLIPAGGSTSESPLTVYDSGFASTERRAGSRELATNGDACSPSTTAMSFSPVDWLDVPDGTSTAGRVPPGAVGIANNQNTCFVNAVVQCLSNTPAVVVRTLLEPAFRRHDQLASATTTSQPIRTADGELGRALSRLLRAIWTGGGGSAVQESSRAFHRVVRRLASGWYSGREQHDAQEFAAWTLSRLRDERFGDDDVGDGCSRHPTDDDIKQTVYHDL